MKELKQTHQQYITHFQTITNLIKRTSPQGTVSYHLLTVIKDEQGNQIPLTTAYANIAKLEAIEYATNLDLNSLKYESKGYKHD